MSKPSQRTSSKAKKFKRGQKNLSIHFTAKKTSKHSCSLCGRVMHGMPHGKISSEVRKLSKTEKRPEALLAGQVCNSCRSVIVEEAIKVKENLKSLQQVNLGLTSWVSKVMNKME